MHLNATFYNLLMEVSGAIWGAVRANRSDEEPSPPLLQLRRGRAESPAWFLVQADEFYPEPLSVERLRVRDVYAAPRLVGALLELMASERWLTRTDGAEYALAPAGRRLLAEMRERRESALAGLAPPAEVDSLTQTLGSVIAASLGAPEPPGTWCLAHSRNRAPAADQPPLVQLSHYLADFNAFRDDAHMAAWRPYGLEGYVWEVLAFVQAGRADSAAELAEQLYYRGFGESEYAAALAELAGRGWLDEREPGHYTVASTGRAAHADAEARTNAYFYGPWATLDEEEIANLHHRLIDFRDALRARSESNE